MNSAVGQAKEKSGERFAWERATGLARSSLVFTVCGLTAWSMIYWAIGVPYSGWGQWSVAAVSVGFGVALGSARDAG